MEEGGREGGSNPGAKDIITVNVDGHSVVLHVNYSHTTWFYYIVRVVD